MKMVELLIGLTSAASGLKFEDDDGANPEKEISLIYALIVRACSA
jgi:hypothetical protein